MMNETCGTTEYPQGHYHLKCISWSAVGVGALVGIGLNFLLGLFSVAIGLSMVSTSKEGMATLAVGGFIGLMISAVVAMFVAGTTAGYLGRSCCAKRNLGVLYGFTTWCIALVLAALLTSDIANYIASYSTFITKHTAVVVTDRVNTSTVTTENVNTPVSATKRGDTSVVTIDAKATNELGSASLLMFALFLVGAIASCFGGHFGMACDAMFCKTSCCPKDMK